MGVEINIEHPEGKQSGAYCATDRRPMAHGIVSRIGYNFTGHGHQEKAAWTNDRSTRAISPWLVGSTAITPQNRPACSKCKRKVKTQDQVSCQAAFASRLAPTEKQSSAAARGKAAPLNNERKLECF
jgi:hypothetical protein